VQRLGYREAVQFRISDFGFEVLESFNFPDFQPVASVRRLL